jgi:hypothetical protein
MAVGDDGGAGRRAGGIPKVLAHAAMGNMRFLSPVIASLLILLSSGAAAAAPAARSDVVREEHQLTVAGSPEIWRLTWRSKPISVCGPDEIEMAMTCPCTGWAYGEAGDLVLERFRAGRVIEHLRLAPLFGKYDYPDAKRVEGKAYVARWPFRLSDIDRAEEPRLASEIRRRPVVPIIRPADYDHDGHASEFLMQVGTLPCGKTQFAAIGVSASNPHLHALTSVAHPEKPLVMPLHAWEALLSSPDPAPVVIWECDDHGSEVRSLLQVSAANGQIRAVDTDYGCPSAGRAGRQLKSTEW